MKFFFLGIVGVCLVLFLLGFLAFAPCLALLAFDVLPPWPCRREWLLLACLVDLIPWLVLFLAFGLFAAILACFFCLEGQTFIQLEDRLRRKQAKSRCFFMSICSVMSWLDLTWLDSVLSVSCPCLVSMSCPCLVSEPMDTCCLLSPEVGGGYHTTGAGLNLP
jgi:hypothetical protein